MSGGSSRPAAARRSCRHHRRWWRVWCTSGRGTARCMPSTPSRVSRCGRSTSTIRMRRIGVAFPESSPPRRSSTASSTSGPPTRTCTRSTRSRGRSSGNTPSETPIRASRARTCGPRPPSSTARSTSGNRRIAMPHASAGTSWRWMLRRVPRSGGSTRSPSASVGRIRGTPARRTPNARAAAVSPSWCVDLAPESRRRASSAPRTPIARHRRAVSSRWEAA